MQTRLDMLPGDFLGAKSPCTRRGHPMKHVRSRDSAAAAALAAAALGPSLAAAAAAAAAESAPLPPSQVPLLTFVFNAGCSSLLLLDSLLFVFSFLYFFLLRARLRSPLWATRSWSSRRHALMTAPARTWRPRPRMSPRGGYGDTVPPSGGERRRLSTPSVGAPPKIACRLARNVPAPRDPPGARARNARGPTRTPP